MQALIAAGHYFLWEYELVFLSKHSFQIQHEHRELQDELSDQEEEVYQQVGKGECQEDAFLDQQSADPVLAPPHAAHYQKTQAQADFGEIVQDSQVSFGQRLEFDGEHRINKLESKDAGDLQVGSCVEDHQQNRYQHFFAQADQVEVAAYLMLARIDLAPPDQLGDVSLHLLFLNQPERLNDLHGNLSNND